MQVSKDGVGYIVSEGFGWFWKIFADGSWEPSTFTIFDKFLDKEKNFVDIGAWIGPTVLYASPKAKNVFAFEPDRVASFALMQNIKLNRTENVVIYPVAVSNSWKNINFGPRNGYGDSMSSELWGDHGDKMPAVSLSSIILDTQPNFIKIDIEGGEKFIFEGSKLVLEECKPTIYLSLHTPWFKDAVPEYMGAVMRGLNVYPYFYNEKLERIENFSEVYKTIFNPEAFTSIVASFIEL